MFLVGFKTYDKADVKSKRSIIAVLLTQVIDEGSTDGTVERLEEAGVAVLKAPEPHGLTQSWNIVRRHRTPLRRTPVDFVSRCNCVL
jgi:hypothetical protein